MCTIYGIRITGIARYAIVLYAFWISVRSPNCAMEKSTIQQTKATIISREAGRPGCAVQLIDFFKFVILSIYEKSQKNAESDDLSVQMLFFNDRITGQCVEDGMCQTAVLVWCEVFRQEDGCDAGGHYDGKNDLFYVIGAEIVSMVCQCFWSVFQQRIPTHGAYSNSQCRKVFKPFIPG